MHRLECWTIKDHDFYGIELRLVEFWHQTVAYNANPYYHEWLEYRSKKPSVVYRQETLGM